MFFIDPRLLLYDVQTHYALMFLVAKFIFLDLNYHIYQTGSLQGSRVRLDDA